MIISAIAILILIATFIYLIIRKREKSVYFSLILLVIIIRIFNILIYNYTVITKNINLLMSIGRIRDYTDVLLYMIIVIVGILYLISHSQRKKK